MRIGVDVLSVSRFASVAAHRRYRTLVFTPAELAQAGELAEPRRTERLAGRFCVKEATCKLLGRGFGQGLRWRDIEVLGDAWGAPAVTLTGGARRLADAAGLAGIVVTLSHQVDLVVAVAAATPGTGGAVPPGERLAELARFAAGVFGVAPEEVACAASFAELGVTPALTAELRTALQRRHGVRIPASDVPRMTSLRRTYQVLALAADW